ncbi:MAG: hypothetical protein ACLPVY_21910 [Acidimicrobiia bacterium]
MTLLVAVTMSLAAGTAGAAVEQHTNVQQASAAMSSAGQPAQQAPNPMAGIKLVSYFPATHGWTLMWTEWRPADLERDFGRIAALHANAVRLVIPAWTFGYPQPTSTMVARLIAAVGIAADHGLRVQLTLFDWWDSWSDLAGSKQWTNAIARAVPDDRRIVLIELKNEIDPDNSAAMNWTRTMLPVVEADFPGVPVTVSTSGQAGLAGLAKLRTELISTPPTVYDYHYYGGGNADGVYAELAAAKAIVAPAPLYIGETGRASIAYPGGDPGGTAIQEAFQARYLRAVENATAVLGLPPAGIWTLNDFTPAAIPLSNTAQDPLEYAYGLFRTDGSPKPSAAVVTTFFGTGQTYPFAINGGFEFAAAGLPAGWERFDPSLATFGRSTRIVHSGTASAEIAHSRSNNSGDPAFYISPIDNRASAGHEYQLSGWAKGINSTGRTQLALSFFDANGRYIGKAESAMLPAGTTGWDHLVVHAVAPSNAATLEVFAKSANNTGAAYFDDLVFSPITGT